MKLALAKALENWGTRETAFSVWVLLEARSTHAHQKEGWFFSSDGPHRAP